jgi:alkanesulfonate monooxygenase SsuD/methylene tetrahydromethanopterin reductase-like flavin-dependent oxidoreductase (luciferase family)
MPSFGIMTAQSQVSYEEILRVWREADAIEAIEHAWLYDHLMPIFGPLDGPTLEGWTLLSALAAQTSRLRVGVCVTSNRFRPPAMLAKIAATVDVVSGGRLDFGIGAGSRPGAPIARREYEAHGLPFQGVPPILIGGRTKSLLRIAARHATIWNIPGGNLPDAIERSHLLDTYCKDINRAPSSITRSMHISINYNNPDLTLTTITEATSAGFSHFILSLPPAPYPTNIVSWITNEIITPSL